MLWCLGAEGQRAWVRGGKKRGEKRVAITVKKKPEGWERDYNGHIKQTDIYKQEQIPRKLQKHFQFTNGLSIIMYIFLWY